MHEGIINLRREFDNLVDEANAFFEEPARRRLRCIGDSTWYYLTDEEKALANKVRQRVRCLLARLTPPILGSPLLDKQDFRKFVRLGRAMEAALRFQPFR